MAQYNFGVKKSGKGVMAPLLYQRGHYGSLLDYCLHDVLMTRRLFEKVLRGEPLENPVDRDKLLHLPLP